MPNKYLTEFLSAAIARWSIKNDNIMTATEIERAAKAATQAVHDCGPNAAVALSTDAAYWKTATGLL